MLKITKNQGSIQVTADKSGFYPFDGTITFPTNSLFTATSANTDMITFKSTSNGDVQFVGNYKDITISGRSYDTKQKFLTAFSNLANQGSVDAYTKAETDAKLNDKLTAQTNANGALFISSSSNDDANSSVALYNSTVKGSNDVAIQLASTPDKEGMHNLAILNMAQANGIQNIAIGAFQRCKGISNIGIGVGASDPNTVDVNGQGNVCIGASSQAHTASNTAVNNSIAIGVGASASSNFCTVVGNSANSKSSHTVAIGDGAYVEHDCDKSVAVGDSARAYGKGSVAIGPVSYADNDKPLDICCGQRTDGTPLNVIQSDANGKISLLKGDGTDTRMVIQDEIEALKNAGGGGTVDAYTKAETDTKLDAKQDKLTAGSGITIDENNVISSTGGSGGSANPLVNVKGTDSATITDSVTDAVAIGSGTNVSKNYGVCVGYKGESGIKSVAVGYNCYAVGDTSIAIGNKTRADNLFGNSIAIGSGVKASSKGAIVIGANATSSAMYCLSIGYGANTDDTTPLVINAGSKTMIQSDANGKISLLKGDGTDTRMVIQDEIEALKNAGGGGTVDAYTKAETDTKLDAKQDKLTAGTGITITKDETAGTSTIATAVSLTDNGNGAYEVGDSIKINSNGVVIGQGASPVEGDESVTIGNNASIWGNNGCVAVGEMTWCRNVYTIAIGYNAQTWYRNCIAIGKGSNATGDDSIAIGCNANATKDTPLVINAGYKSGGNLDQPLTVLQSDSTGKISVLLGDGTDTRMVIQDEIAALKAEIAALKGGA